MGTKININVLSSKSINNAIKQLEAYRDSLDYKVALFTQRLAELGLKVIEERIDEAGRTLVGFTKDGMAIEDGSDTEHESWYTTIEKTANGYRTELHAKGKDLLFIEFGAGTYYNAEAGESSHPKGAELGYTIGSYGKGLGKYDLWVYRDENGEPVMTHGTFATMPMLGASNQIIADYVRIAREVFGK